MFSGKGKKKQRRHCMPRGGALLSAGGRAPWRELECPPYIAPFPRAYKRAASIRAGGMICLAVRAKKQRRHCMPRGGALLSAGGRAPWRELECPPYIAPFPGAYKRTSHCRRIRAAGACLSWQADRTLRNRAVSRDFHGRRISAAEFQFYLAKMR